MVYLDSSNFEHNLIPLVIKTTQDTPGHTRTPPNRISTTSYNPARTIFQFMIFSSVIFTFIFLTVIVNYIHINASRLC